MRLEATGRPAAHCLSALLLALALGGCNIVPSAPLGTARPTGAGNSVAAVYALPVPAVVVSRGLTDRLDAGASVDAPIMARLWGRYTLVERPRYALAVTASAFAGPVRAHGKSAGVGIGSVAELELHPRARLVAGAGYDRLSHEVFEPDGDFLDFDFEPEPGEDFSEIAQGWAFVEFGRTRRLRLGVACDYYLSNDASPRRYRESDRCLPVIGVGFAVR